MRFKNVLDGEARKRRRLAAKALADMRQLDAVHYPIAMFFDKMNSPAVERRVGESWPEAFARSFGGLTLLQLRDYAAGMLERGTYRTLGLDEKTPTAEALLNYFRGAAVLLITTEVELASAAKTAGE